MRLEDGDDAAESPAPGGGERRHDLARQMRIVIDEGHAVALAAELKAPSHSAKARERLAHPASIGTPMQSRGGERPGGVLCVVRAWHRQLETSEAARSSRARSNEMFERPPSKSTMRQSSRLAKSHSSAHPAGARASATRRSSAHTTQPRGASAMKRANAPCESGEGTVVLEVIGFDVRDEREGRVQLEKGPVALVGLDDEPLAVGPRGVRADLVHVGSDDERGTEQGVVQDQREHRRRRRLAVRPRYRNGGEFS